jgi:AraC-like DNA-binding protein
MQSHLEQAIKCFEYWSRLVVSLHDFTGQFRPLLPQERFSHGFAGCRPAKDAAEAQCVAFDIRTLRRELFRFQAGAYKVCHANLLEWIMPVTDGDRRLGILFAGAVRPPTQLDRLQPQILADNLDALPRDDDFDFEHAAWIMEALRQLAATLAADLRAESRQSHPAAPERRDIIHRFIGENCDRPDLLGQLAEKLFLSRPRTIHVVREETGYTFQELLHAYRMRLAAARLRFSNESIAQIALQCGFRNVASLHRNFKACFKMTPLAYRKCSATPELPRGNLPDTAPWPGRPR